MNKYFIAQPFGHFVPLSIFSANLYWLIKVVSPATLDHNLYIFAGVIGLLCSILILFLMPLIIKNYTPTRPVPSNESGIFDNQEDKNWYEGNRWCQKTIKAYRSVYLIIAILLLVVSFLHPIFLKSFYTGINLLDSLKMYGSIAFLSTFAMLAFSYIFSYDCFFETDDEWTCSAIKSIQNKTFYFGEDKGYNGGPDDYEILKPISNCIIFISCILVLLNYFDFIPNIVILKIALGAIIFPLSYLVISLLHGIISLPRWINDNK